MTRRSSITKVLTSTITSSSSEKKEARRRRSSKDHLPLSSLRSSQHRSSLRSSTSSNDDNSNASTSSNHNTNTTNDSKEKKKRNSKTRSSSILGSMFKSSNSPPSINKLVEYEDWDGLSERLSTPTGQVQAQNVDFTGFTVLYDVCGKNPPVEVVKEVITAFPDALKIKDVYSRLPLHVACGTGARVEVIKMLIKCFPKSVMQRDDGGKLALHYAVEYACNKAADEKKDDITSAPVDLVSLYGTIKALTDVKAGIIHVKDKNGEDVSALARRVGKKSSFSTKVIRHFQEVDKRDSANWANSDDEDDDDEDDGSNYDEYH